jgi:hypothetical protein
MQPGRYYSQQRQEVAISTMSARLENSLAYQAVDHTTKCMVGIDSAQQYSIGHTRGLLEPREMEDMVLVDSNLCICNALTDGDQT